MTTGSEVFLQLTTEIEAEGDAKQRIEFATVGTYYQKGQSHYYIYEETEVSGMAGGRTSLKVSADRVAMRRQGANAVDFVFMLGDFRESLYETPYGVFEMETHTTGLEISLSDLGIGMIEIRYELVIKGLSKTSNLLRIWVS
jgi:uncharacterized beta-barrel protein YwiB (DUF1934 family)